MSIAKQHIVYSLAGFNQKIIKKGSEIIFIDADGNELNSEEVLKAFGEHGAIILQGLQAEVEETPEEPGEGGEEPEEPSVESVVFSPVGGNVLTEVQLQQDETFVYTQTVVGTGLAALEVDVHIENPVGLSAKEQFTVYADEADPTQGNDEYANQGVTVTYEELVDGGKWSIDFGAAVTQALAASGEVRFFGAVRDADKNFIWGDMFNTTPDMISKVNVSLS